MFLEKTSLNEEKIKITHKAPTDEEEDNDYDFENCSKPPGGIAWIVNKNLEVKIKCYMIHSRISYVVIDDKLAVFGLYLPSNDSQPSTKIKMISLIDKISKLVSDLKDKNISSIIGGDLNMDIKRKNKYDIMLINWLKRDKLNSICDTYEQEIEHTFFKSSKRSHIDYILAGAKTADEFIDDAEIIHTKNSCTTSSHDGPINQGDHHPLKLDLKLPTESIMKAKIESIIKKYVWSDQNKLIFNLELMNANKLVDTNTSLLDKNNHQQMEQKTFELINKLIVNMRNCGEKITEESLKSKGYKFFKNKRDEAISNLKNETKIARQKWKKDGGDSNLKKWENLKRLLKLSKKSKVIYDEYELVSDLNKDLSKHDRKYWQKLSKLHKPRSFVDVDVDQAKILFQELFNNPLISSPESNKNMQLVNDFKNEVKNDVYDYKVNEVVLNNIIKTLNTNCALGFCSIPNEFFKYGNNCETIRIIKKILELYINYNIKPQFFNVGLVKLIIKDENKEHDDINNIRPITLSDPLTIIFEKLIMHELNLYHKPFKEQFGFKKNSSCAHAIFTVRELALWKKRYGRQMIICALDASKAFDKMNRPIMFIQLKKILEPCLVRSLINYYEDLKLVISNNGKFSNIFSTTYGVKQGGPASPRLFAIYMEPLSTMLQKSKIGIKVGKSLINHVLYADDTSIICESISDLNKLLEICTKFGLYFEVKFNPSKTQFMIFNKNKNDQSIKPFFDNLELEEVNSIKFLGAYLSNDLSSETHVSKRVISATLKVNCLYKSGFKSEFASSQLKMSQYKSFIRPSLLHDAENQYYSVKLLNEVQSTESTLIKRAYGIPARFTKSTELNRANGLWCMKSKIFKIKSNSLIRLLENEYTKDLIQFLLADNKITKDPASVIGYTMKELNHYNNDLSWLILRCKDQCEVLERIFEDESSNLKCQLLKHALEHKGKTRKMKILKIIKMVKNKNGKIVHMDLESLFQIRSE